MKTRISIFPCIGIILMATAVFLFGCTQDDKKEEIKKMLVYNELARCKTLNECFDRMAEGSQTGASLQVFTKGGTRVYSRESGTLTSGTYGAIYSASKWITAAVIMAMIGIEEDAPGTFLKPITLATTTGDALGWSGAKGAITVEQLLSLTSGLYSDTNAQGVGSCIMTLPAGASDADKDSCVTSIRDNTGSDAPGAFFTYNSNHMAVAQRIAEKVAGQTWQNLFKTYVADKLGFTTEALWYANPRDRTGDGSLAGAYGLWLSADHYARFLRMLINDGLYSDGVLNNQVLKPGKAAVILQDHYGPSTAIKYSQFASFGFRWHYGLGNWLFCSAPDNPAACGADLVNHSFGVNGFYPWIDRNRNYYAVIGVDFFRANISNGIISMIVPNATSLFFAEQAKPFIYQLLP